MVAVDVRATGLTLGPGRVGAGDRAARAQLRRQIAALERRLTAAVVTSFRRGSLDTAVPGLDGPRLLSLGELERVRDGLATRLAQAGEDLARRADEEAAARALLERMRLEPGRHRFVRVADAETGGAGCGVWHVRPRLGLVGMLMGWWQVKLSSGCPLAT